MSIVVGLLMLPFIFFAVLLSFAFFIIFNPLLIILAILIIPIITMIFVLNILLTYPMGLFVLLFIIFLCTRW